MTKRIEPPEETVRPGYYWFRQPYTRRDTGERLLTPWEIVRITGITKFGSVRRQLVIGMGWKSRIDKVGDYEIRGEPIAPPTD